ncbi:hypothetical protein D9M69_474890 [compost metagenome]
MAAPQHDGAIGSVTCVRLIDKVEVAGAISERFGLLQFPLKHTGGVRSCAHFALCQDGVVPVQLPNAVHGGIIQLKQHGPLHRTVSFEEKIIAVPLICSTWRFMPLMMSPCEVVDGDQS